MADGWHPELITIEDYDDRPGKKSIGIKASGRWFSAMDRSLRDLVGQQILAQVEDSEFHGKIYQWIRDYQVQHTPPSPLTEPPSQRDLATDPAKPSQVDREASIVAQALTKAVSCDTPEKAWEAYRYLYTQYLEWR